MALPYWEQIFASCKMNHFFEAKGVYGEFILQTNLGSKNQIYKEVLESGESVSMDGNIINCRRKNIPVHFTLSPLNDGKGKASGILIVLEDNSVVNAQKLSIQEQFIQTEILGHSSQIERVFELMDALARTNVSVLITGEIGTGKDLIAEVLVTSQ